MAEAEKHTRKLLSQLDEKALHEIWLETENGILAVKQGFHDPERCEMEHDIALDVEERLLERICREAQKKGKKRRRKR